MFVDIMGRYRIFGRHIKCPLTGSVVNAAVIDD
jgi:hypothetical protein